MSRNQDADGEEDDVFHLNLYEGLLTGHLPFLALSLASLVLATLFATSLKFPHAITHTAGVGLERRSRTAGLTSCLVGIRKFA